MPLPQLFQLNFMGGGRVVFNPKRHEHELCFTTGLPPYRCSGCKGRGANKGYMCQSCPEFVLHETCFTSRDEIVHPYLPQHPFTFRATTRLRHNCVACGVLIRGFLFQSSKGLRVHPLCLDTAVKAKRLRPSGHTNHDLQLYVNEEGGKCSCIKCGKKNINWKYECKKVPCNVTLDMNCAIIDFHDLSQHGITQVYKPSQIGYAARRVATVGTVFGIPLLGAGVTAVIN